jgi:hypothetical protein
MGVRDAPIDTIEQKVSKQDMHKIIMGQTHHTAKEGHPNTFEADKTTTLTSL